MPGHRPLRTAPFSRWTGGELTVEAEEEKPWGPPRSRFLNSENEMKRIFGSKVVKGDQV